MEKNIKTKPELLDNVDDSISWDEWLSQMELKLKERGYHRYVQNYKREDFAYWKTFKKGENKIYQVGILFFDWRRYDVIDSGRIGILYECMLCGDGRVDMTVSKDGIDLIEFEKMSKTFYEAMSKYTKYK